jgi:hypothetical protein
MSRAQAAPATADSKGLQMFGFAFAAVTAAVVMVACALVHMNADGRLTRSDTGYQVVVAPASKLTR